ncbi:MAG: right-handed parallel beta-helix repeat-containing protein [Opitutales bacterium]|nr:right-handed parallel beta-helix repeat-containing protein [Opitutales bacterium]
MNIVRVICIILLLTGTSFAIENFDKQDVANQSRFCTISSDSKVLEFDTTGVKIRSFAPMLVLKTGLLKPNTRYILKMKVHASNGDDKSFLHFLIRNMVDVPYIDGTDIIKYNVPSSAVPQDIFIKFKTPEDAEKYAPSFMVHKNLKCKISDFSIKEDDSIKFISIKNDYTKFEGIPSENIPTGAKEFSIDQPNNPTGEVVEASRFGIVPEKNVSFKSIKKALAYCKKVKASKLVFKKDARYNLFEDGTIIISQMEDFVFDGNGATFVFRKYSRNPNFYIQQNTRFKICNLKIDWDWETSPLASLAEIIDVNKEKEYIDFKLVHYKKHPQYPNYLRFAMCSPWDAKENSVGLERETNFIYDMHKGRHPEPKFEWLTPNTIRIYGKQAFQKSAKKGFLLRVQHFYYDMTNMTMDSNYHITLSDITMLSCAGHAFGIRDQQKYTLFDNVKIIPPNDKKRIITTTADHLHVASSQGYIKLENCDFSYGADDCINFHDNSSYGTRLSENSIESRHSYGNIGDKIEFRNNDYSPLNFTATLKAKKEIGKKKYELVFDKKIPNSKNGNYVIFNKKHNTHNIIVRNCYFHHNRARGILVLARDVTIENCKFKRNEMGAIKLETGYTNNSWCEGYGVNNVVVRNCTFEECNPRGNENWGFEREIFMGAYLKIDPSSEQSKYPVIRNALFANNTFINNYGMLATIGSAENIIFADNKFKNTKSRKFPQEYRNGFFATHAKDIIIVGNEFEKSDLANKFGVWYENSSTSNIKILGNKIVEKKENN